MDSITVTKEELMNLACEVMKEDSNKDPMFCDAEYGYYGKFHLQVIQNKGRR